MIFVSIFSLVTFYFFYPIFISEEVIITYGLHPFDICAEIPELWSFIKVSFVFCSLFSFFVLGNLFFNFAFECFPLIFSFLPLSTSRKHLQSNSFDESLHIVVGKDEHNCLVSIPKSGLFQNFLITGTIGSGKTSSAMYPFTKQLLSYSALTERLGMLILDVKGNYFKFVESVCEVLGLTDDLIVISLDSGIHYNPLDKPHLKPQVLANRLKTILLLFSENNSESFWLDKAEEVLCECIKLCRLYNDNYVTFLELHKLIFYPDYYKEKISFLRKLFISNKLSRRQVYDLNSCLNFFQKDFENLDQRTLAILKSEIGRITNAFISDFDVLNTFSPSKDEISFDGFSDVINSGKIVVLSMNIAEYRNLSMIIAAYLKLDFQTEVISNLSNDCVKPCVFICDEYDKYASKIDGEFFSLSREAMCINIVSTQSYSSLKNVLKDEAAVNVIVQNLINKIWFRTDDIFTIEEAQKLLGKEDKDMVSKSVSENAKETKFSYFTNSFNSEGSNISESFSTYTQKDFIFDTNFFSQELQTFYALTFLSDGSKIFKPCKLKLLPYFKEDL